MKNKFLVAMAVVIAAGLVGGLTAWGITKTTQRQAEATPWNGQFEGAAAHFTSYEAQGYPDLTYAAENAVKAVVSVIKTEEIRQQAVPEGFGRHPFFEFFGIPDGTHEQVPDEEIRYREQTSGGSGVIISADGYIVTNHHVVENASKLTVKLPNGKTYDAKLIGTDADTEIALIKIEEEGLPALAFGSSDALRLGEWVLAIGNPYSLHSTITAGIVSAKARSLGAIQTSGNSGIESFIQTDAAVNPGNSGGALVNTAGELVGINTLIYSRTGSYAGYAFAVPETIVRKVVRDLREYGVVQRALIGIMYSEGEEGLVVREVAEGGAAQAAGIEAGDVIEEIDGLPVITTAAVAEIVSQKRPGDAVKISVKRDGKVKQFNVVLRNRAGKSEPVARETFDAIESLGGEFADIRLTEKQQKELGIKAGVQVAGVKQEGVLARARVQRGYIITHLNGREVRSVNDLYRITGRVTSIEGVYPNGRAVTYSLVE